MKSTTTPPHSERKKHVISTGRRRETPANSADQANAQTPPSQPLNTTAQWHNGHNSKFQHPTPDRFAPPCPTSNPSAPSTTTSAPSAHSQSVIAPPYDVIDPEQRARLAARSSHNVVNIDLPEATTRRRRLRRSRTTPGPLEATGRAHPRRHLSALGPPAGLHRPRRPAAHPPRHPRARTRGGVRRRARSARTNARTPAPRKTACVSPARRRPTSPPSSASTTTRPTPLGPPSNPT